MRQSIISSQPADPTRPAQLFNSIVTTSRTSYFLSSLKHDTNTFFFSYSTVPNQPAGVFWAVLNRLFIIFQVITLILSEMGWPMSFFNRFFPVLGSDFGLGPLGVMQCLYVCRFPTVMLPLTPSRYIDLARLFSRTMSTTLRWSRHFSYPLSVASISFWDSSSGNMPRSNEA